MTNPSAGWYPDPAPESPPGRLRYWDGGRWTEHLHDPAPAQAPAPAPAPEPAPTYPDPVVPQDASATSEPETAAPGPYAGSYPQYPSYPSYPQASSQPYGTPYAGTGQQGSTTTPDGVPLSGWWWRVLARVLDGFIAIPLNLLAVTPVVVWQWDDLKRWVDGVNYAAEHNTPDPPGPNLLDFTSAPGLLLLLSLLIAYLVYETVFLFWKQATPGKLIVGLRVRRRDSPDLPGSAIFARVGFVILGQFCIVLLLLDYLWPLWDGKRQALHDKVAGTNVVRPEQAPVMVAGASPPPRW